MRPPRNDFPINASHATLESIANNLADKTKLGAPRTVTLTGTIRF